MGEFAQYKGSEIKIGTCEDMLYLRADQAHLVTPMHGSVDPVRERDALRFRFPFPDEDGIEPGEFSDSDRGFRVDGAREVLDRFSPDSHDRIQFTARQGYVTSLPCPEISRKDDTFNAAEGILTLTDGSEHPYRVGRNGFRGALFIRQQRYYEGKLVTIVGCACGALWRLETLEQAEPVIVALRSMADRQSRTAELNGTPGNEAGAQRLHTLADRVAAGYTVNAETVSA